jgi:hypothetical protein
MGWFVAELRTGNVVVRSLPVKSGSINPVLNKAGVISATVKLPMAVSLGGFNTALDVALLTPGRYVLGLEQNGVILDAGPIWQHDYDLDKRELKLTGAGVRSYFEGRYVLPVGTTDPYGANSTFTALSLRTIAKRVLQQAQAWTAGSIPLTFESDVSGTAERTYLGEDLQVVDEVLAKLSGVDGGPDIDFRPVFINNGAQIQWQVVTGSPELKQAGADWVWDASLPSSPVRAASIRISAKELVTQDWEIGGTPSGATRPVTARSVSTILTDAGFPIMESSTSRNSVTTQSVLDAHALAAVRVGTKPVSQFSFSVSSDPKMVLAGQLVSTAPRLGEYRPGDYGVLGLPKDPYLGAASRKRVRVLGYSYDYGSEVVKFTCAESRS